MDERLKCIADHYGYEAQSRQLIEEMAELTQAINKSWRATHCYIKGYQDVLLDKCYDATAKEIADVEICLEQFKYLFGIYDELIDRIKNEKINRQLKRMERERNEKHD